MSKQRAQGRRPAGSGIGSAAPVNSAGPKSGQMAVLPSRGLAPYNPNLLELAREQWARGEWRKLASTADQGSDEHPQRGELMVVRAAALLQLGDLATGRHDAARAAASGLERTFMARVLLASVRNCLGRAAAAIQRDTAAVAHFESSLFQHRTGAECRRVAAGRLGEVKAELQTRQRDAVRSHDAGTLTIDVGRDGRFAELASRCLAAADVHEEIDAVLDEMPAPDDQVRFLLVLAEQLRIRRDNLTAVNYLSVAKDVASGASKASRQALARHLVAAGQPSMALDMLLEDSLADAAQDSKSEQFVEPLRMAYQTMREVGQAAREHGHELLLAHLKAHLPKIRKASGDRKLQMVEIGTTRESVPGQGSTRRLGEFCAEHGIHLTTVDMDPHNSRVAARMFARLGMTHVAVTMKGEDYLRTRTELVDFTFLDAYDFDHGQHSELRQSRYEKFLGSRIDELACHQMHLDCAASILRLLSPHGVVCIDDTWQADDDSWTAKGTLAMPYLLSNGFELIDVRNRAALLRRSMVPASTAEEIAP